MQETEIRDTDWASRDWTYGKILRDKTIVVTGCSSHCWHRHFSISRGLLWPSGLSGSR